MSGMFDKISGDKYNKAWSEQVIYTLKCEVILDQLASCFQHSFAKLEASIMSSTKHIVRFVFAVLLIIRSWRFHLSRGKHMEDVRVSVHSRSFIVVFLSVDRLKIS